MLAQLPGSRRLLVGQAISVLADTMSLTLVPLVVIEAGGSGAVIGLVGALQTLPNLLFGLPAGALADRLPRRTLLVTADVVRIALLVPVGLAGLVGWSTLTTIALVTGPVYAVRTFWLAGWTAMIPQMVTRDGLRRVFAYIEALYSLGPALAGFLLGFLSATQSLMVAAAGHAVGAAVMMLSGNRLAPEHRTGESVLADIREGIAYVRGHRPILLATLYSSSISVLTVGAVTVVSYDLKVDRPDAAAWLPAALTAATAGTFVGALAAPRLAGRRFGRLMLLGGALIVGTGAVMATAPLLELYVLAVFGWGIGWELTLVPYLTLRTIASPPELQGRVGAVARLLNLGFQPIGMLLTGVLLDLVGASGTFLAIAGAIGVVTLAFTASATFRGIDAAREAIGPASVNAPA